jgi:hypothetical protein
VVLGTEHVTWEEVGYEKYYELMRANHWDEINL